MITSRKMKKDSIRPLVNEILALPPPQYQPLQFYQPKRSNFLPFNNSRPRLTTPPPRPMIEVANNVVFFPFHDTYAHTSITCSRNLRMNQIMGHVDVALSSSFVPTPSLNVVLLQMNKFDGKSIARHFEPIIEEEEDLCH
jgi:hypothetical protein